MTKKQTSVIFLLWIIAIALSLVAVYVTFINRGYTEVAFIDVGQGDACFIQTDRLSTVLIDGGDKGEGKYTLKSFLDIKSERCVDAVFLSHMHADHINGIVELLDTETEIKQIYVSEYAKDEEGYDKLLTAAENKNAPIKELHGGDVVKIDNVTFKVIGERQNYTDQNDMSMVLRFECGENSILFTGDATAKAEDNILDEDIDTDILKVAHHGSSGSTDIDFLERVTAELFVISVGEDNRYKHPSGKTLGRLKAFDAPIVRTDYDGTISIIMTDDDIKDIKLSREREM